MKLTPLIIKNSSVNDSFDKSLKEKKKSCLVFGHNRQLHHSTSRLVLESSLLVALPYMTTSPRAAMPTHVRAFKRALEKKKTLMYSEKQHVKNELNGYTWQGKAAGPKIEKSICGGPPQINQRVGNTGHPVITRSEVP